MVSSELARPSVATLETLHRPSVMQLARAGHFRAIAQWINTYLVPQGIFVCVSAASRPGYLLILVEFQYPPERERLVRFICHRLCKLKSDIISGVQIVACYAGSSYILWQQSIRLTPANRRRRSRPHPTVVRRAKPLQPKLDLVKTAQILQAQIHQLNLREHLNHPRSRLLAKSAAAAFLLGCGVEVVNSTLQPSPTLSAEGGNRPAVVETALEKVPVTQLEADESDPTVTLAFSGGEAIRAIPPLLEESQSGTLPPSRVSPADVTLAYVDSAVTAGDAATISTAIQSLQSDGVDVVNLANNSLLQSGSSELTQTLDTLEQVGIQSLGVGRNEREARRPEIVEVKGQRIAYFGYSDSDDFAAGAWNAGTNPGLSDQVASDIQAIRDQVDWVVVNYHWSQDLTEQTADWQVNLAHSAIDQGADLVVGHHPDVLQGAEIYKGRAIAYSLGNFIFSNSNNPATQQDYDTAMLRVSLRQSQMRLEFLPVQVRQDKPEIVSGEKAEAILQRIRKASEQFEQPMAFPLTLDAQQPLEAPSEAAHPPLETQPPTAQPHSLEPSFVESGTPMTSPAEQSPSDSDGFITYPDATEEIPGESGAIPKLDTEPLKQETDLETDGVQPLEATPDAEADLMPEPITEEIIFPDEVDPFEAPIDYEMDAVDEAY